MDKLRDPKLTYDAAEDFVFHWVLVLLAVLVIGIFVMVWWVPSSHAKWDDGDGDVQTYLGGPGHTGILYGNKEARQFFDTRGKGGTIFNSDQDTSTYVGRDRSGLLTGPKDGPRFYQGTDGSRGATFGGSGNPSVGVGSVFGRRDDR